MFKKSARCLLAVLITSATALHAESILKFRSKAPDLTLLVMPARTRVVQLGFDLAKIRSFSLVTYEGTASTRPFLHYWNGAEWMDLTLEELTERGFLTQTPARVVIIGDDSMVAPGLSQAVSWCPEVHGIPSIKTVEIVNALHPLLGFNDGELEWLAGRHNLKIKDLNEDKRGLDPYSVPRAPEEMDFKPFKKPGKRGEKPAPVEEQ